jgi:hypothetical protein
MGRLFESDGTRIRVRLDSQERQLLARLLDEVGELLDDGRSLSGDPLAELVGFDLQLPDDVHAGDDTAHAGGPCPDRPGPGVGPPRADGEPDAAAGPDGELLGPDGDPALARLLPQAHREDPELAAEFRRLTEVGLRSRKRSNLALASAALQRKGHVVLSREEASALLKGLTDTRLVLGERLGLRTDEDADAVVEVLRHRVGSDDPRASVALLYDVLTWWQESLVSALSR